MPFYRITKFCLFFFLWFNSALSQNYPGKNYTAANELPNNAVRSLLVDSNNILWIGTDNGVVKKENDDFKYFFEEDGLAMNSCWAIAEDENHSLWFGSYGAGLSMYDGLDFKVISEEDGLAHNEITKLFSNGNYMYVGTSNGVSIVDINTLETHSLKPPPGEQLFRVLDFFEYDKNIYVTVYNYGNSGVYKIHQQEGKPSLVRVSNKSFIYSVFVDNDSIYSSNKGYFTKSSLADYVKEKDPSCSRKMGTSILWDYVKTRNQKIYAAGWGIHDPNGGIFEIVNDQLISRASDFKVPSKKVISLAYDPGFERLYVGTMDSGLFEISLNPQIKFQGVPGKEVQGFARTENSSAVLLEDGILIRGAGREHKIALSQLKKWQENYVRTTKLPLPTHEDSFYELDHSTKAKDISFYDLKAHEDTYWVNTNIGIFAITPSGELQHYLPVHSEEINFTETGKLIETDPYGGVRIYDDPDAFIYTQFEQEDPQTPTMVVNSLQKGDKTYFLSVFSGLYVWENNEFRSYLKDGIWKENKLRHITSLGENLAISTEFGDVYVINDEDIFKVVKKIPRAQIQGNTISFLEEYKGSLLVGTEKGLTLFKDDRKIFLDEEQGLKQPLLSAEVIQDRLKIGSEEGFYSIDLEAINGTKSLVEELKIKEVFINNNLLPSREFAHQEEIQLPHDQNTILFKFGTNAHPYPDKLKYQYRLNPGETWSFPSSKPEIFLPFLTPNDYKVSVKVLDESTGLSFTQPLISLSILPPFWKTWWFPFLIMSAISLAIYGIYSFQIRQTRNFEAQKRMIQKRFEETKMEALLAQMNPHFIFNAMNSIQNYILDSDIDNATLFLGDFARLIRLNLDQCTKPTILLIEEIEYLQSYIRVENTRFNNAVRVIFETDPSIDLYDVEIPTMILQTFVENVFVHAFPDSIQEPTLKVSFKLLPQNLLECKIEDNGIGFSSDCSSKLHKSRGVSLVRERLTLLGYDVDRTIQVISAKDRGTSIILRLQV